MKDRTGEGPAGQNSRITQTQKKTGGDLGFEVIVNNMVK